MVEKLVAFLLALTGLAFLALLTFVKVRGDLAGEAKVSAFLLITGAILISIGCSWLFSKQRTNAPARLYDYNRYLFRLRRHVEFVAAAGLIFTAIRAMALLGGADWVPRGGLLVLAWTPVLVGLFALRVLPSGAFQSGLFPDDLVSRWSVPTRKTVILLIRIGWFGYPALLLVSPGFHDLAPWTEGVNVQFAASVLISLLYASQVMVLHFGKTRPTPPASVRG
jgi:hypothetical protein